VALQKQTVRMSVTDGLDTKTDEKNVVATKFLEADNVVYTKTGAASKRNGYEALTTNVLGSTALTNSNAVTTFKQELLNYSSNRLYTFAESQQKWVDKGTVPFALVNTAAVDNTNYRLINPSIAVIENLACYAYEERPVVTHVRYSVLDNVTGTTIFSGTIASAEAPKVVAIQGKFFIFTVEAGALKFRTINFGTPTVISSVLPAVTMSGTNYDVQAVGVRAYFIVPSTTSGVLVGFSNVDSVISGPRAIPDGVITYNRVSIAEESTGLIRLCMAQYPGTNFKTILYNADLTMPLHSFVSIPEPEYIFNCGSVKNPLDTGSSYVYASVSNNNPTPAYIKRWTITATGTLSSPTTIIGNAMLESKPAIYNNKVYFAMGQDVSVGYQNQDTFYIMSEDGEFIAKYEPSLAPKVTTGNLTPLITIGSTLNFTAAIIAEFQVPGPNLTVATTVKKLTADFSAVNNYFDSEIGENLHVAGGILKMYDGNRVVEHGFLDVPDTPIFSTETGTGAVLPNGTYQYVVVWAWKDKSGQLHRSAPSVPLSHTITGGPKKPFIQFQNCLFTQKENVEIEIYRTEANGTTFYKHKAGVADIIVNDKALKYTTVSDTLTDAELISNEVLYTTGGVLDNISADSCKYITSYKNRLFTVSSDGTYLQYSKTREQNGPIEFNDALKIKLDSRGGKATTLAVMDDHLIIFKESAIFTISGEGPNNLGEQDDFRLPFLSTSDAGCTELNSVVTTPSGIMFKSRKGLYMLGRDFNVSYLGAPVEAYNSSLITSATLVSNTNQVRFTTDASIALVYDYFHQRWSTFSNVAAVDATIYGTTYVYARSTGLIMKETVGQYTDNSSFIPMTVASAWISLAGIQGFERFYKMLLLGSYKSSCKFKVSIAYDYDAAYTSEVIIDAGSILGTPVYGTGTYGSGTPYGGADPLFQWRIFPKRQKCETFRFKIEDINSGVPGESFSLSNFAAEIGLKPPAYKRGNSHSAGTK
jgi:hypothetical protein